MDSVRYAIDNNETNETLKHFFFFDLFYNRTAKSCDNAYFQSRGPFTVIIVVGFCRNFPLNFIIIVVKCIRWLSVVTLISACIILLVIIIVIIEQKDGLSSKVFGGRSKKKKVLIFHGQAIDGRKRWRNSRS